LLGLKANVPFAMAPGMGLNAFLIYTLVLGRGVSWQTGLGAKTGLANVVTVILLLFTLFFAPLIGAVSTFATSPALIVVGASCPGLLARHRLYRSENRLACFYDHYHDAADL